jgi:hypothetical protein
MCIKYNVMRTNKFCTDLFQQPPFLNYIAHGLLTNATGLIDVFKSIQFFRALMLDDPHLKLQMRTSDICAAMGRTLPKAPFPTARWRSKWKRLTSPSKSTGSEKQHPISHSVDEKKDNKGKGIQD